MGRILAIDYGSKRSGIATTDPLGIIATPLEALLTHRIFDFLTQYFEKEQVEKVVVGWPKQRDGSDTNNTPLVRAFLNRFKKLFPEIDPKNFPGAEIIHERGIYIGLSPMTSDYSCEKLKKTL